ncbi:hypothetical protein SKAU_G00088110 [Synaphobranchus kaupii]|uniref:Ig-like domain-containing protein n=1 Tax=Synaphobranchus kaupii TaxID=118154 RepID=A0A9Q1FVZ5_SYNKA|nr:hypothetical protein SKAU_G00088110 [Synaphobranchus kaupii]
MRYSNDESQEQSTLPSLPLHIHVAVGWVILQVSPQPAFVGGSMTLTCRVRRDPVLMEVVFYKDGTELQRSAQPKLHLAHLMQQDQGSYWCTATWKKQFYWTSAESLAVEVSVIDILSEPVMEAFPSGPVASGQVLSLKCSAQLTFPQPGLHLIYRYLQDGRRLGVATSRNKINMPLNVGLYQCKVTVGGLGITKWSNKVPVGIIHEEFAMTTNGPYSKTLPTSHHTETDTPTASGAEEFAMTTNGPYSKTLPTSHHTETDTPTASGAEEFAMTTNGPYSKTLPTSHHTETDTPPASGAGFYAVD